MTRILVALAALAIGAAAFAQTTDQTGDLSSAAVGFSFRIGGYFPADSKVRDVESVFWDTGIEYDFETSLFKGSTTYVAGDWIANTPLGGKHLAALTLNQRFYSGKSYFVNGAPYFFLGVGTMFTHAAGSNSTTWVGRGGIGAEFPHNYFFEVGGYISPKINGINPSGISASLGYRFRY